jgi:RimJ/RimL family protein N-acetyltransferase
VSDIEVMTGPRVTLRAPTLDDAEPIFERMASDPEVSHYMSWRPHRDVGETRRVIAEIFNVGGETVWLIELRGGDGPVGVCGWRRLLDKAKRDPTVYRVTAHCHVDNIASARLLQRSGLTFEGRLARYAMLPNISVEPQDCLLFGMALR